MHHLCFQTLSRRPILQFRLLHYTRSRSHLLFPSYMYSNKRTEGYSLRSLIDATYHPIPSSHIHFAHKDSVFIGVEFPLAVAIRQLLSYHNPLSVVVQKSGAIPWSDENITAPNVPYSSRDSNNICC